MDRLLQIDRRWIFLCIFLAVLVPFLMGLRFKPGAPGPASKDLFAYVEKLPARSVIVMSFDYGPAAMPELQPMAVALLHQAFKRDLRVLAVTINPQGFLMAEQAFAKTAPEAGARYGEDYVNLGYKPGGSAVIQRMGTSIAAVYPKDVKGTSIEGMKVMDGVHDLKEVALAIDFASGSSVMPWIAFAHERFKTPMAVGITAVMATDYYPYYQTKQLVGLLNGLRGAEEYEYLVGKPDFGALGMASQSIAHGVIILFVILGNIGYFASRRRRPS